MSVCTCFVFFFSGGHKNNSLVLKVLGSLVGTGCVNLSTVSGEQCSLSCSAFCSCKRHLLCSMLYAFQGLCLLQVQD